MRGTPQLPAWSRACPCSTHIPETNALDRSGGGCVRRHCQAEAHGRQRNRSPSHLASSGRRLGAAHKPVAPRNVEGAPQWLERDVRGRGRRTPHLLGVQETVSHLCFIPVQLEATGRSEAENSRHTPGQLCGQWFGEASVGSWGGGP